MNTVAPSVMARVQRRRLDRRNDEARALEAGTLFGFENHVMKLAQAMVASRDAEWTHDTRRMGVQYGRTKIARDDLVPIDRRQPRDRFIRQNACR